MSLNGEPVEIACFSSHDTVEIGLALDLELATEIIHHPNYFTNILGCPTRLRIQKRR
jgi:hypothetical protein